MKSHNERCKECKKRIYELLTKLYGEVEKGYSLNLPAHLEEYQKYAEYDALKTIYTKLQNHRGHDQFVRAKKLPPGDLFVVNPGFAVEIDESQHFTKLRQIALENYPAYMKCGFDKTKWIERCIKLNIKDPSPIYRDEQRAWYDTLRDFAPHLLGINPTIRLYLKDHIWCGLNPKKEEDISTFKKILGGKI
jgi:hypothetical protein